MLFPLCSLSPYNVFSPTFLVVFFILMFTIPCHVTIDVDFFNVLPSSLQCSILYSNSLVMFSTFPNVPINVLNQVKTFYRVSHFGSSPSFYQVTKFKQFNKVNNLDQQGVSQNQNIQITRCHFKTCLQGSFIIQTCSN